MSAPSVRTSAAPNVRRRKRPSTVEDLEEALDEIDGEEASDFLANLLDGRFADIVTAERIKENGLAAKHLIAARKAAGDLIEVEIAEKVFFEAARSWRDIWAGFPSRIGPMLAADLGLDTDPVVEALTTYVQQQLEQLGEPSADFAAKAQSGQA